VVGHRRREAGVHGDDGEGMARITPGSAVGLIAVGAGRLEGAHGCAGNFSSEVAAGRWRRPMGGWGLGRDFG
jgi:hypothetical protein